eukprot:CAMPEP_0113968374 /NCGR_PEP_ID=MMETSP0011_2-20120614/9495_1 /TAXON_ID=101924 /ORGANISM="Rhodosorus marinus" /LENGTH=58 /DNA_ID=CAMNT_0000981451 /DNA_START=149 /DNA_END=325 /DNA_ORIENTATION=+ /assembly_acc=CAM_ASM_000156
MSSVVAQGRMPLAFEQKAGTGYSGAKPVDLKLMQEGKDTKESKAVALWIASSFVPQII